MYNAEFLLDANGRLRLSQNIQACRELRRRSHVATSVIFPLKVLKSFSHSTKNVSNLCVPKIINVVCLPK